MEDAGSVNNEKKHSCIFGLCVKNNSQGLPKVFENLSKIQDLFHKVHIVAYYDQSQDDSLSKLQQLSVEHNLSLTILNESGQQPINVYRTVSIANARNNIMKHIMGEMGFEYDLFAMMDSNGYSCQGDIRPSVLGKYLRGRKFNEWDSLSFARKPYYDLWAFSNGTFQLGCWSYPPMGGPVNVADYQKALQRYITELLNDGKKKDALVPVDSSFCGFAIYKKEKYRKCFYSGYTQLQFFNNDKLKVNLHHFPLSKPQLLDCEHRSFHFRGKMLNNAQMQIACEELFEPRPEDLK